MRLHFLVSCANCVCLAMIIAHGFRLSAKVEDSTSRANDAFASFETLMTEMKGRVAKTVDDIDDIVLQMNAVLDEMRLHLQRIKHTENSTSICKNTSFLTDFADYAKDFC